MSTFSRLRYVIAANVNALIEKAEDPEKLLRALIREMEDAGEEARMACADLLAEQQHLGRRAEQLAADAKQWQGRAETAVEQGRDDLARAALKARVETTELEAAARDEQKRLAERVTQMEQDMATLKTKLAEAKTKLKDLQKPAPAHRTASVVRKTPGERRIRRAMDRFDHLQAQVENLEARVRSYDVGGPDVAVWNDAGGEAADPTIEAELDRLKQRLAREQQAEPTKEQAPA